MENAVWIIFGMLAVFIGIGIMLALVSESVDDRKIAANENAVKRIIQYADFVCRSDVGTMHRERIEIASGSVLSTVEKSACVEFKEWRQCAASYCDLNDYVLDLNTEQHLQAFETHSFNCSFEKITREAVAIECKG